MQRTLVFQTTVMMLLMLGCSGRKEPAQQQPPAAPEQPGVYKVETTGTTVKEEAIPKVPASSTVRADFNRDTLEDIALAEHAPDGGSLISIYLQRASDTTEKLYYKAVTIREEGECRISAMLSSKGPEFIDLVAILNYTDGRKEMVHYRGEGNQFREIIRAPLNSNPPTAPATPVK